MNTFLNLKKSIKDKIESTIAEQEKAYANPSDINLVMMATNGELDKIGEGSFSEVFEYQDCQNHKNDRVIIKSKIPVYTKSSGFYERQRLIDFLREIGVNTPKLYFSSIKNDDLNSKLGNIYEVESLVHGNTIGLVKTASLDIFAKKYPKLFNFYRSHSENCGKEDVLEQYNLMMTKHRIATGKPHIQKFINGFLKLYAISAFVDCHSENIMYNAKDGYSFIDLTFLADKKTVFDSYKSSRDLLKSIKNVYSENDDSSCFDRIIDHYRDYYMLKKITFDKAYTSLMRDGLGIEAEFDPYISTRPILKPNEHFEKYVFNGVLLNQFFDVFENGENDIEIGSQRYQEYNVPNNYFAMSKPSLLTLKNAVLGDKKAQGKIIFSCKLDSNFDFVNGFDSQFFLDAMNGKFDNPDINGERKTDVELKNNACHAEDICFEFE